MINEISGSYEDKHFSSFSQGVFIEKITQKTSQQHSSMYSSTFNDSNEAESTINSSPCISSSSFLKDQQARLKQTLVKTLIPKIVTVLDQIAKELLCIDDSLSLTQNQFQNFDLITLNFANSLKHSILLNDQPLQQIIEKKPSIDMIGCIQNTAKQDTLKFTPFSISSSNSCSGNTSDDSKGLSSPSLNSLQDQTAPSVGSTNFMQSLEKQSFMKQDHKSLKDKPKNLINKNLEKKILNNKKEQNFDQFIEKQINSNDYWENQASKMPPLYKKLDSSLDKLDNSMINLSKLFKPLVSYEKFDQIPSVMDIKKSQSKQEDPGFNFLETLQSITKGWKDNYQQVSLKSYQQKTDKAPPPADLFANLPTTTNFQLGMSLFSNINSSTTNNNSKSNSNNSSSPKQTILK
ncbi:UNKNOWN [Stylonychia lemnae]|uniref:Uncharacterized protein n=1 Tax=Stylonychia lemnae TaxID=5949 RepID=A0A078ABP7_STYLE|nr:UNKNOWN [Stylonychia lemnae]|eukprot:CDW79609.1 UNKNOWN [Stylonychia lemnae]